MNLRNFANNPLKIVAIIVILFLIVAGMNYYKYVIKKDYVILIPIECNPEKESCFEDVCLMNGRDDCFNMLRYYKVIIRRAYNNPECVNNKEGCDIPMCGKNEEECQLITCDNRAVFDYTFGYCKGDKINESKN